MKKKTLINKFKHILNEYVLTYEPKNKRNIGRPNKHNNFFYIKHILNYLFNGASWSDIGEYLEDITPDAIRKKMNKWISLGIFNYAFNDFLDEYKKKNADKLKNLFIDATIIKNISGKKDITGICKKLPNKKSTKVTLICDENKIGLSVSFAKSNEHDSKHIEKTIKNLPSKVTELYSYRKPGSLTADLGYLINNKRKHKIRTEHKMTLNTDVRKNMKKKYKSKKNIDLLKKRIKIEHLNSRIMRTFKGLSIMRNISLDRFESLYKLAFTMQIFEYFEEFNDL